MGRWGNIEVDTDWIEGRKCEGKNRETSESTYDCHKILQGDIVNSFCDFCDESHKIFVHHRSVASSYFLILWLYSQSQMFHEISGKSHYLNFHMQKVVVTKSEF